MFYSFYTTSEVCIGILFSIVLSLRSALSHIRHFLVSNHHIYILLPLRKCIRSSSSNLLFVPSVNTNNGTIAFSVAATTFGICFQFVLDQLKTLHNSVI